MKKGSPQHESERFASGLGLQRLSAYGKTRRKKVLAVEAKQYLGNQSNTVAVQKQ